MRSRYKKSNSKLTAIGTKTNEDCFSTSVQEICRFLATWLSDWVSVADHGHSFQDISRYWFISRRAARGGSPAGKLGCPTNFGKSGVPSGKLT